MKVVNLMNHWPVIQPVIHRHAMPNHCGNETCLHPWITNQCFLSSSQSCWNPQTYTVSSCRSNPTRLIWAPHAVGVVWLRLRRGSQRQSVANTEAKRGRTLTKLRLAIGKFHWKATLVVNHEG
jgi:hypothetical protein